MLSELVAAMGECWNNHDKRCEVALRPDDAPHTCSCWERERIKQLEDENKLLALRVAELEKALIVVGNALKLSFPEYITSVLAPCQVQPLSSCMCERGTKSCKVKHTHFYPKDN